MSEPVVTTAELVRRALPTRPRAAHKGSFGRVYILGGCVGYTGAPVLAARAAVRTGSGLVHLGVPAEIWPVVAVKCDEAMPAPLPQDPEELLERIAPCDALLVGPGLGLAPRTRELILLVARRAQCPLILDADGINAVAGHIDVLDGRAGRLTVLTPHEGELARLLGRPPRQGNRTAEAAEFARAHGCVLVRKGRGTVTAFPDGEIYVNQTGNPGMAKGGSGDVLAGMVLSLLGQGIRPKEAVPAAVWLHGRAGDLCAEEKGEYGMTPTDMIERIPYAIKTV